MALALIEAGARAVYCVDLPKTPSEEWEKVRDYAAKLAPSTGGEGRLEYVSGDVTDQVSIHSIRSSSYHGRHMLRVLGVQWKPDIASSVVAFY